MRYSGISTACGRFSKAIEARRRLLWRWNFGLERSDDMTLSECIARERRVKAGFRRRFMFTVSAVLLFSTAALLLLGYERIYMGNILRWIIDALAPLGEFDCRRLCGGRRRRAL